MKLSLEKYIQRLMFASFLTPLFLFPAIWTRTIFPFIVPKVVFFRSLVLLMLGCYLLLLWVDYKKYKVRNSPITFSVLLFFVSLTASTFFGVDVYKSMWDNHERMLGLFTLAHYGMYYAIATVIMKQWVDVKKLLQWFFYLGTFLIFLGAWQKFVDHEFILNQANVRVSATLGNAIYFAGYGLFLGFIGLILSFQEIGWKKKLIVCLSIFDFSAILMSRTKGTMLGLIVSLGLLILLYLYHNKQNFQKRRFWGMIFGIGSISAFLAIIFRTTGFVRGIPGIGQILNANFFSDTGGTRLMAWKIAFEGWKQYPIIGWGPNNYYYAFNKFYNPDFLNHGWGETWFDNAHNVLMNTLTVQGVIGLLVYFGLLVVPLYMLWKRYREGKLNVHLAFLSIAFLVAHFIHNLFVFEDPTSYLYFFFFLAFVSFITSSDVSFEKSVVVTHPVTVAPTKVLLVGILIAFLIFRTNIDVAKANAATLRAIASIQSGVDSLKNYQTAVSIPTPHIDDVRGDIARTFNTVLPHYAKANRLPESKEFFVIVIEDMKKNRMLHPMDIRVHMQEAQLLQLGAQYYNNMEYIDDAEALLNEALQYSPKRQQIQYMLAMLRFQKGNILGAEELLLDSINNNPKIQDGWWRLVFVYAASGDVQNAEKTLLDAETKGVVIDPERLEYVKKVITEVKESNIAPRKK